MIKKEIERKEMSQKRQPQERKEYDPKYIERLSNMDATQMTLQEYEDLMDYITRDMPFRIVLGDEKRTYEPTHVAIVNNKKQEID